MKVIAVDFDGCLCRNAWPEIGEPNMAAIKQLIRIKTLGNKIILWTCREGKMLADAVRWCRGFGITFDAVNDNIPERKRFYGDNTRKVSADEYWDDRAVCVAWEG
jgi:hypothetical protein